MSPLPGCGRIVAGANGERITERRMRRSSVDTRTFASFDSFRNDAYPSAFGCQPFESMSPSAATSAATTTRPTVPASFLPLLSTMGPRGPARSTVRYAWPFASDVYCGPWRIWIDHARRTRMQSAIPTSTARPPTRTKKPGLRKNGASAREYGYRRRRVGRNGRVQCRRVWGIRLFIGQLVRDLSEGVEAPRQLGRRPEGLDGHLDGREAARVERLERAPERAAALRGVELL